MAKFIIAFGVVNKKMLFPLLYIIVVSLINIYNSSLKYNEVFLFIVGFGFSLGQLLTFFLNHAFKYRRVSLKIKKVSLKQYIKDYFILFIIDALFMLHRLTPFYFLKKGKNDNNNKYREMFINDSLEIIFITIVTYFFLRYKYYIHHIISLIFLVILSVIFDLVLGNFIQNNTTLVITSIFYVLISSVMYTYFKYLMQNKYYHYMDILFIMGTFDTIIYIISLSVILIVQSSKGTYELIFQFYEYYKEYGTWKTTSIFLVGLIPRGFIMFLLEMKSVDLFGPSIIFVSYEISKIPNTLIFTEGTKRWIVLVLSLFQILFILFYLEILEYNFCSLNKNTNKNIREREHRNSIVEDNINDIDKDNGDNDEVDIKGYDISESLKMQGKIENLTEMNEIFEEKENDD